MKVVLRHQTTGRYYHSPGKWVRRADNALTFEDPGMALQFCRSHQIAEAQPVHRLAPYLMPLLRRSDESIWICPSGDRWYQKHIEGFVRN